MILLGLDRLTALVNGWKVNESSYSPAQLRECLDSFKEVLFMHLDQEVWVLLITSQKGV